MHNAWNSDDGGMDRARGAFGEGRGPALLVVTIAGISIESIITIPRTRPISFDY
jgi:hypothetical protein